MYFVTKGLYFELCVNGENFRNLDPTGGKGLKIVYSSNNIRLRFCLLSTAFCP